MAQDLTGKIIADKYRLDSLFRPGNESDLYSATHRLMDKPFSVRVLHPNLAADQGRRERFFEQAKLEAAVSHTGVPAIVDFGTDADGNAYCIYEAVSGDSLKAVIAHDGQFPAHTTVSLGQQIASALAAAHSAGLVHGNLNSENILLSNSADGTIEAKLVDFGSANPIIADTDEATADDFAYLSPEICAGAERADEKSDIYAAGVILYEMLAGVPPFTGEKPTDVMLKHIEEPPAPLSAFRSDVPDGLEPVVLKALSKNADMRHAAAQELADELAAFETVSETKTAAAAGGFWKTAVMMAVGIGLLASALIYATWTNRTDPVTSLQPDANGQPVQPLNPATGIEERNLASLPGSGIDANSNLSIPPGTLPGGDGYDPWANARSLQPPGGTVTIDPNSQSPFTMDPGCTMLPSGLVICPTVVPQRSPSPTPRPAEPANANTGTPPAATPTPRVTPQPARTPTPRPPVASPTAASNEPSADKID